MSAAADGHAHPHGYDCPLSAGVKIQPSVSPLPFDPAIYAENRARLAAALRGTAPAQSFVLLQGGETEYRHETDHEPIFRQESFFHWTFGVKEPDCYGCVNVDTGKSTLFIPRLPEVYAVWMGAIKTPAEWQADYGVDEVRFVDELKDFFAAAAPGALLVLKGLNTDGKRYAKPASFEGIASFPVNEALLWPAITELRVIKTKREQAALRYSATVTSEAHIAVMQHVRPGLTEYHLESLFRHWCYYHGGCRNLSYTCICATGHNGSVLHYGHAGEPNGRLIRDGDMCLFDMGAEYQCWGSDVTTSFPASGRFTQDQRLIYEAVLAAVYAVEDAMKPGVNWVDMHALAYRTILTKLKEGGVLQGDVEGMMSVNLGATFMPHGLGHMLGLDTHDVGGYPEGVERPKLPGYASLRTARDLKEGMYITVEPGCYFINHLLDAALADPSRAQYLVPDAIARFRGFGGVRIEDDVLVTADGCENFTHAPRTVEDVEAACAGKITSIKQIKKHK